MADIIKIGDKFFEVRGNSRRKNISVGIDSGGVYFIACPSSFTERDIKKIVGYDIENIISALARKAEKIPPAHRYLKGEMFLFRGAEYPLEWTDEKYAPALELRGGKFFMSREAAGAEYRVFESWYQRALYSDLKEILPHFTKLMRVNPRTIHIKTVKSLWGSCSAKGSLTFCTRIAMAEPELLKYIVVHELCHFTHMNHSPLFWNEVAKHIPDYKEKRILLNKNAHIYKWW